MQHYFITRKGNKIGPLTLDELKKFKLYETDLVWTVGVTDWQKPSAFSELQSFIISTPPPTHKELARKKVVYWFKGQIIPASVLASIIGFLAFFRISYLTSKVDNSLINIEAVYHDKEQNNLFMFLTRPIRAIFSFFLDNNIYINTKSSIFAETVVVSFIDVFFILGLVFLIKYLSVPEQPTK